VVQETFPIVRFLTVNLKGALSNGMGFVYIHGCNYE